MVGVSRGSRYISLGILSPGSWLRVSLNLTVCVSLRSMFLATKVPVEEINGAILEEVSSGVMGVYNSRSLYKTSFLTLVDECSRV